ncbi:MAG: Hsp70 family protein [Chthoniobacterales bacterium]
MIAGIDLGTTNSLVGVMDAGFPVLLADGEGKRLTPSAVYYAEDESTIVGREALRMRGAATERVVTSAKRLIGSRGGDTEWAGLGYEVVAGEGGAARVRMGERLVSPEAVSAKVLRELKEIAREAMGEDVNRAVITVPAYFNDAQRAATKRAGELAGWAVERILSEPTAAALAYGLDKLGERSKVAVYDLGGGTFDVSVLELADGVFQVLSTDGDTRLGGDDLDGAIVNWIERELEIEASEPGMRARLLEAAEGAKRELSEAESTVIRLPFVGDGGGAELELTRERLERMARPIFERTFSHCRKALADAEMEASDLDEVILVGGSTRMPLVREMVRDFFGKEANLSQNPDEAVALGAVIQAGILEGSVARVTLLDVTPLSLGIETFGGLMNVIIPRNTTIPVKRGEMFTNAVADQREMRITVLQGEREMARDNWRLGDFEIDFTPAARGVARVGLQFEIDADGILHVLARDVATGRDRVVEIRSAVDVADEAVGAMIGDSVEHAFEDMNERIFTETKLKAEEMLPAVEVALERMGDDIPADERERIVALVSEVRATIAKRHAAKLKRLLGDLDDATQTLATLLIEAAMGGGGEG